MKLRTLSTGSVGNSYILTEEETGKFIVIDCGIRFEDITHDRAFTGFRNCDIVLCGHSHKDHSLSLESFEKSGVQTYSYKDFEKPAIYEYNIGNWQIKAFPVKHNVINYGFIIKNGLEPFKTFCYVTDFFEMPKVEGVTDWLYEINYVEAAIDSMIERDKEFRNTNFKYHNSLEKAKEYFSNLKTRPKSITICHLSHNNANAKQILKEMKPFADKVIIAGGEENVL